MLLVSTGITGKIKVYTIVKDGCMSLIMRFESSVEKVYFGHNVLCVKWKLKVNFSGSTEAISLKV